MGFPEIANHTIADKEYIQNKAKINNIPKRIQKYIPGQYGHRPGQYVHRPGQYAHRPGQYAHQI